MRVLITVGLLLTLQGAPQAVAIGGILSARKVAETLSHRITAMNHGQGFTANLVTAEKPSPASFLPGF